jgi:hypothetical protein
MDQRTWKEEGTGEKDGNHVFVHTQEDKHLYYYRSRIQSRLNRTRVCFSCDKNWRWNGRRGRRRGLELIMTLFIHKKINICVVIMCGIM